jgi:hypothetical protein
MPTALLRFDELARCRLSTPVLVHYRALAFGLFQQLLKNILIAEKATCLLMGKLE